MSKKTDDFLALARKRFEQDAADEKPLREEAEKCLAFVAGEQWDSGIKQKRTAAGRPALTFNRCHTFVQQVANEARQNKTAIHYSPFEDADKETAEIYEGLARHIHYSSMAQVARETAIDYSSGGGFGYYGYLTKYCVDGQEAIDNPEQAGNLDLEIRPFLDPFAVYGVLIPAIYGLPRRHAFVIDRIPKDDYIAEYGDTDAAKDWGLASSDSRYSGWIGTDEIIVAEYWTVEEEKKDIDLPNGGTRPVTLRKVKYCKINGGEIIPGTETEWVGSTIPIYPVLGKQMFVKGKPKLFSVVSHQLDAQQLINFYKTRIAETLGTAPIQPFIVYEGQIKGYEREWAEMNSALRPYLTVRSTTIEGKEAPLPQRQVFEPPILALSQAAAQEIDDTKATTGIYDASLGNKSNEQTGIAIQRRQQQADATNMHFLDNLTRTDQEAGKDMAEIIPKIYDTPRIIRILGKDETPKIVKVNQPFKEGDQTKQYQIGGDGVAKYDIVVTTERSFSTKRMESFDMMQGVMQSAPQTFPMWADIFFRNSDIAGSDELADRFKKMLPQQLQEDDQQNQPIPPQAQQMIQQLQQHLQIATQTGQQMSQEIDQYKAGAQVKQMELESKERTRQAELQQDMAKQSAQLAFERWKHETGLGLQDKKINTDATLKSAQMESQEAQAAFKAEVDFAKHGAQLNAQQVAAEADRAAQQMGDGPQG